jgi:hypothetical protein
MIARLACFCLLATGLASWGQPTVDQESQAQLAKVRRVYVDLLTGGESALKLRDLLMTSLQSTKLFIVTENQDKADAILKGTGQDTAFTETFQSSDNLSARSQLSLPVGGSSSNSRYSNRTSSGLSVGENESRRTEERKHEAIATVRLVGKDGDVLWSTTQESPGGKFLGAAADVADKVARKLAADVRLARHEGPSAGPLPAPTPHP